MEYVKIEKGTHLVVRNMQHKMIDKKRNGERLTLEEYLMYHNPVYAEHRRCGAMPEDFEWSTDQMLRFAERYAKYIVELNAL